MERQRNIGIAAVIGGIAVLCLVLAMAYNAGVGAGMAQATQIAAGATGMVPGVHPGMPFYGHWGFGLFGIFGLFFKLLLFGALIFVLYRLFVRRGPWGGGPGIWGQNWRERRQQVFEEWHRQAHEHSAPEHTTGPDTPTGTAQ